MSISPLSSYNMQYQTNMPWSNGGNNWGGNSNNWNPWGTPNLQYPNQPQWTPLPPYFYGGPQQSPYGMPQFGGFGGFGGQDIIQLLLQLLQNQQIGCDPIDPTNNPQAAKDAKGLGQLKNSFATLDKNNDGVLDRSELIAARNNTSLDADGKQALNTLLGNQNSAIFSKSDGTDLAWFGISAGDIDNLRASAANDGQTLTESLQANLDRLGRTRSENDAVVNSNQSRIATKTLKDNFTTLDTDHNGVLDESEIRAAARTYSAQAVALNSIANNNRELMFASIDPGNAAWHGLSRQDLDSLSTSFTAGKTSYGLAADLRAKISAERGYPADLIGFRNKIDQLRRDIPNS